MFVNYEKKNVLDIITLYLIVLEFLEKTTRLYQAQKKKN